MENPCLLHVCLSNCLKRPVNFTDEEAVLVCSDQHKQDQEMNLDLDVSPFPYDNLLPYCFAAVISA